MRVILEAIHALDKRSGNETNCRIISRLLKYSRDCCSGGSRILESGVLLQAAEGRCTEVCRADQSAQSAEIFFAFIFQLSGWALVAPSCFAQQVPDVKGLRDPGPPCASVSCSNFAHAM